MVLLSLCSFSNNGRHFFRKFITFQSKRVCVVFKLLKVGLNLFQCVEKIRIRAGM